MNILITAGNTHAPIDRVRVITNVFTGRTGAHLARTAWARGHRVTVLTSQPYTLTELPPPESAMHKPTVIPYQTFDDLAMRLQQEAKSGQYECVVHAAMVSEYLTAGMFAPQAGTFFNARTNQWERRGGPPTMIEQKGGKIGRNEPEMWLRLVRAPRLVDRFRDQWGFHGLLVKFELDAGVSDAELLAEAERSRQQSKADVIVINTLETSGKYTYLGPFEGRYEKVDRRELSERLLLAIEEMQRTRVQPNG